MKKMFVLCMLFLLTSCDRFMQRDAEPMNAAREKPWVEQSTEKLWAPESTTGAMQKKQVLVASGTIVATASGEIESQKPLDEVNTFFRESMPKEEPQETQASMPIYRPEPAVDSTKATTLEALETVKKTWGDSLNPTGKFPQGKFSAVYFNTETKKVIKSITTNTISISRYMEYDQMDKLWVYFVWKIQIPEDGIYDFSVSQSWANTRLILDKKLFIEPNGNSVRSIELKKWEYLAEVEFLNQWHVVDFSVNFEKYQKTYSLTQAQESLKKYADIADKEVWMASVYESENEGHVIPVTLKASKKPVVLILNSYSTVLWDIKNPNKVEVLAAVFNSYEPWVKVQGLGDTPVLRLETGVFPVMYQLAPNCIDMPWYFHCEMGAQEYNQMRTASVELFGNIPSGFSGVYGSSKMLLPETVLDKVEYEKIKEQYDEMKKKEAKSNLPPSFDTMFDK